MFALNESSGDHALKFIFYELLTRYDLISRFKVNTVMMLSCTKHTRSAVYDLKKKKRKNIRGKTSQGFNYENHTIILREPLHNMPTFYTFRLPRVIFELPVHHLALFIIFHWMLTGIHSDLGYSPANTSRPCQNRLRLAPTGEK